MIRRIIVAVSVSVLLAVGFAATALALPGEGFDQAPYGVEDDGASAPNGVLREDIAPEPVAPVTTVTEAATSVPVLTFVLSILAAAAIMTVGGWLAGASHERRALAH